MREEYKILLKQVKGEREKHQMDQSAMGQLLGMGQSLYSRAEGGYKCFDYNELCKMCTSGLDVYYIFTGRRSSDNWHDLFTEADFERLLACLKMICTVAIAERNTSTFTAEWEQIYRDTQYIEYADYTFAGEKNIFRSVRAYEGKSQIQMTDIIGVDVKKLRLLENGKVLADSKFIHQIYQAYGISPGLFLQDRQCLQSEISFLLDGAGDEVRQKIISLVKFILEKS